MSYASGGTIEATDYNGIAQTTVGGNVAWVWGTGYGAVGYGQDITGIASVSSGATVTATQWAGIFNTINRCLGHQGQTQIVGGGNLNAVAGETITYWSNVTSSVTQINLWSANAYAQGTTTTGSNFDAGVSSTTGLSNYTIDRIVSFASAEAARYFFNAGGQLNFVCEAINSADSGSESSFSRLVSGIGGLNFRATDNGGRTGSGITLDTNLTTHGYYDNLFNSPTTVVSVTDTTTNYTASTGVLSCYYGGTDDTTNGARGSVLVFRTVFNIADKTWDDTMSLTYRTRVDIVYPETTYLTSVWGTPTVS